MYAQNIVQPILLPFLQQERDMLFHQDKARPRVVRATQHALQDVRQALSLNL